MNDDERFKVQERVRVEEAERDRLNAAASGVVGMLALAAFFGLFAWIGSDSGCMETSTVHHAALGSAALVAGAALLFVRARRR